MIFITLNNWICSKPWLICSCFFQRKEKETKRKAWLVGRSLQMLTKRSEKQLFFLQRFLNLGWRGGQKYSQNRSKSSNKWKCHEGWSLKTLRVGGVEHQLRKWSQKDLIKSWCLLNQNGQSTTKVDSMKLISDEESACFAMPRGWAKWLTLEMNL